MNKLLYRNFITLKDGADKTHDNSRSNYLRITNWYILFLFFLFLFYSVFSILFFGDVLASAILFAVAVLWLIFLLMKNLLRRFTRALKLIIIGMYILLILTVSFFHIYTHRNAGVDYFYFSLLFAIPFFFNDRKDYPSIFLIVITITLSFTACIYFNFDFLPKSRFLDNEDYKVIKLLNILFSVITFLIDIILVSQKDGLIHWLVKDTMIKNSTIEDLLKANNDMMTQQIISNNLTEENITDVLELAETNSPLFLEKFQSCFPDFTPSVLHINPKLIYSEIHLCALMRLNFDTKKIALITKSSVRAIESKKYRIRKKLHISPEININNFILKI